MKSQFSILLSTLMLSGLAKATPTLYPTDPSLLFGILNPTNSSLVADDSDPRKVWVLPPNVGEAIVHGLHTLGSIERCGEVRSLARFSESTVNQMNELNSKRVEHKKEVDKLLKKYQEARVDAETFATNNKLQALMDLDNQIQKMEDRLADLYKSAETCYNACEQILESITHTERERYESQKARRKLAQENIDAAKQYDKKKAIAAAHRANLEESYIVFDMIQRDLTKIYNQYNDMWTFLGNLEGGRAALVYDSGWDANMTTLRSMNQGRGFQFEKIVTEKVKLFTNITSVKDIPASRAIIQPELPGRKKEGYYELDGSFQSALTGNILLSLVGACPMLQPDQYDISPGYGANKMAYGMTFTYEFPAAMKLKATAKYNMYKMYEKVLSSGSRGGFFSSSSYSRVEERTEFKDSFNVDWASQDPANEISEARRLEVEHEMRKNIMERIGSLAIPTGPNPGQMLAPGTIPPRGAAVVASSLREACPAHIYCVAGSLILSSLDAIFGSSSSTASYLQTQNFEATETWSDSKVVMKPWTTTFIPAR